MFKFLQSMFGKKEVVVKQPEFHEEIKAQVEAQAVQDAEPFPVEDPAPDTLVKKIKKPAAKKASVNSAPAKKTSAKKPTAKKSKKQ